MATKKSTKANGTKVDGTNEFFANAISPSMENFVFMEKATQILEIGFATEKNIVLYGPGE